MGFSLSHGRILDVGWVGIDRDQLPGLDTGPIDLRAWFGPKGSDSYNRPLELEIGSGKGTFLVQQAKLVPNKNFIGLEYARAFWRYAADRCRRHGLQNVRLVHVEAGLFIRNYVPDNIFEQIHIYFPDPWPKKRHHKRRLIQEPMLRQFCRILVSKGTVGPGLVRIVTDHDGYWEWIQQHVALVGDIFEVLPFDSPESAGEGELVGTNFERKYRKEGRPFYGLILRKRAGGG